VRYGRGSPAHISATRQADFAALATICGARNSYRSGCANVGFPDGLAQQDTIGGIPLDSFPLTEGISSDRNSKSYRLNLVSDNNQTILGFDPGKDKCGVAVMDGDCRLLYHQVLLTNRTIDEIGNLCQQYQINQIVMGDQTTAKQWKQLLTKAFPDLPITLVDERYSSLEARDRYWQMYPPKFLTRLIPQGMRQPPRSIDDLVAIILIERYLDRG
jgi:RNase H-fold protein (predicted Holliday junction resolvase)